MLPVADAPSPGSGWRSTSPAWIGATCSGASGWSRIRPWSPPTWRTCLSLFWSEPQSPSPASPGCGWTTGPGRLWPRWCWPIAKSLDPGDSCYAQLRFEERALVYPGDRFILRSLTPVTTIGGGAVFDPAPRKHGTDPRWRARLAVLEEGPGTRSWSSLLREAFPDGIARSRLEHSPYLWRFDGPRTWLAVLEGAERQWRAPGQRLFHGSLLEESGGARWWPCSEARAKADPLDPYLFSRRCARASWPAGRNGRRWTPRSSDCRRPGRWCARSTGCAGGRRRAAWRATTAGWPRKCWHVLAGPVQRHLPWPTSRPAVGLARQGGAAVGAGARAARAPWCKVGEDLYYEACNLRPSSARISSAMEAAGQLTLAEVRDLLGTSRKYAQALLEHMDSEGLTLRVGDARRLRRRRR